MASTDEDVEQLLAPRTTTPITQLKPDLSDQATRKIHGEVTITWPYSSISRRFAFLLAEPDFRLRREKGQVRIVLNGPSAEAVGKWELGSGDEITLALDGAEWTKDEEPARPPGSRLDWQLKFADKVILKVGCSVSLRQRSIYTDTSPQATLGETQETKFININEPTPAEPAEEPEPDPEPVAFVEIDTAIFDDEPSNEQAPALPATTEYASPIFMKRSRAAYGPLFEFNLDDEIEDDGGRRGKGRKRPRYSVLNGRWRYREESDSPEPEVLQDSSSPAPEQDGDVVMQDTPLKPQMADGACQTDENELPGPPQREGITPSKSWKRTEPSSPLGSRVLGQPDPATTDTGVQASPPKEQAAVPDHQHQGQQQSVATSTPNSSNPFSFMPSHSTFPQIESDVPTGFGAAQTGVSAHVPIDQQMQSSPLFGTGPAPTQTMFSQPSNVGAGFGVTGGPLVDSVRFGFGQQPQSTFGGMQFVPPPVPPQYYDAHYYPASHNDHPQSSDHASPASHHPHQEPRQHSQYNDIPETASISIPSNTAADHEAPLWPIGAQVLDHSHAVGHLTAPEELRLEGNIPEETSPGMIPPAVADGTRNRDEMKEEGILSKPVFEQGVPREALPHGREGSADEDEDSMDSDEEADYDEDEKGDDYDMRNYDRVSDDDEGFDGEDEILPDGGMLDEDGDEYCEDDEEYDEEDYEEDGYAAPTYYQQTPRQAPQPPVQKAPVVIDLLSDSDEDEASQAPPPPRIHAERPQMVGIANSEPEDDRDDDLTEERRPRQFTEAEQKPGPREDMEQELEQKLEHELVEHVDDEARTSSSDDERGSNEEDSSEYEDEEAIGEGSEVEENEPRSIEISEDVESIKDNITLNSVASIPEVEEAMTSSPPPLHDQAESEVEEGSEEDMQVEEIAVEVADETRQHTEKSDGMAEDDGPQDSMAESFQTQPMELAASFQTESRDFSTSSQTRAQQPSEGSDVVEDRGPQDSMVESFQTQPVDLAASFQTRSEVFSESFQTQTADMDTTVLPDSSHRTRPTQESFDEDIFENNAQIDEAIDADQNVSEKDADEADVEDGIMLQPQKEEIQLEEESEGDDTEGMAIDSPAEEDTLEDKTFNGFSDDQRDASPSSPISQHQEEHIAPTVDISMTTVSSHIETRSSDEQITTMETQETEVVLSQHVQMDEDRISVTDEKDQEMAEAVDASGEELESDAESIKDGRSASKDEAQVDEQKDLTLSEPESEPLGDEIMAVSSPPQLDIEPENGQAVEEVQEEAVPAASEVSDEDFHDASELPYMDGPLSVTHNDDRASFVTADSQVSESRETEDIGSSPTSKPRRKARKHQNDSGIQPATSAVAYYKNQQALHGQLISPRTTRSKAMTFQKGPSPNNNHEDMSIQLARAALKSPSKTKLPASSANKARAEVQTDLVKRLGDDMPTCVPLKDLKSHNRRNLEFAAVATSQPTPPKRTKARQYVTCFTATDPSIAPDGVIEVSLFRAHKDFLPIVKPGDSVLLRGFTVISLPDRGFGLQTHPDESSWAVFDTDGRDALPQIRGPPVEMSEEEKGYLLDLRGWYAALDGDAKAKLAKAAGELVEKGKRSRG